MPSARSRARARAARCPPSARRPARARDRCTRAGAAPTRSGSSRRCGSRRGRRRAECCRRRAAPTAGTDPGASAGIRGSRAAASPRRSRPRPPARRSGSSASCPRRPFHCCCRRPWRCRRPPGCPRRPFHFAPRRCPRFPTAPRSCRCRRPRRRPPQRAQAAATVGCSGETAFRSLPGGGQTGRNSVTAQPVRVKARLPDAPRTSRKTRGFALATDAAAARHRDHEPRFRSTSLPRLGPRRSEPGGQRVREPRRGRCSPTHATYPSGRINTAVGAATAPSTGSSHAPAYRASTR